MTPIPARAVGPLAVAGEGSTLADVEDASAAWRGRRWRLGAIVVLCLVVLLGAIGAFGVRSQTVSRAAGGYRLTLTYPRVARAGLDVPWHVMLRRDGGFAGQKTITLAVTAAYFDIYETQGFDPEPDSETRDGTYRYLSFTPPPTGAVFQVDFDTYVQPSAQLGRHARLSVVDGGQRPVSIGFSTWLVP